MVFSKIFSFIIVFAVYFSNASWSLQGNFKVSKKENFALNLKHHLYPKQKSSLEYREICSGDIEEFKMTSLADCQVY